MQEPLTVAINAQISLDSPGGTETNVVSLMKAVGETHKDENFLFLNKKKRSQALLSFTGLNQQFIDWRFAQVGYPLPFTLRRPLGTRAKRLRAVAGRLGPGATLAYWMYRGGRDLDERLTRQNPTAREVDPILRAQGVLIEMSFEPLYERQASFEEVHALLVELGFRFAGFKNQSLSSQSCQPLQAHCFYIRAKER